MTAPKQVRAMRARRDGLLSCGHYTLAGQLIVKVGSAGWVCAPCRLVELDDLAAIMREPARPSERDHDQGDPATTGGSHG